MVGRVRWDRTRSKVAKTKVHHIAQRKITNSILSKYLTTTTADNCQPLPTVAIHANQPRRAPPSPPCASSSVLLRSRRNRDTCHIIHIQLVSTRARPCPRLPNRPPPDGFVPLRIARGALLLDGKEAPARKRRRPNVVALLADCYTVQHSRQQIRRRRQVATRCSGRVERPAEPEACRDSPQILCESVRALCCGATGIPGGRCYGNSLIL